MHPIHFVAIFLTITVSLAHAFEPKVGAILNDNNLTPSDRFHLGIREQGAQDINNPLHCSLQAARRVLGPAIIPNEALLSGIGAKPNVEASFFVDGIQRSINRAIEALVSLGDREILERRVCVGLYNWGEMNARSYSLGYILVDPIAIKEMWNLPDRTMFSDHQVYLHEFAHQLQYWYGNPFQGEPTVRRSELAADCVASALLHVAWRGLDMNMMSMAALGMIASAESVGDNHTTSPHHHGTAEERKRAVVAGKSLVDAHFTLVPGGKGLTSRRILERCNYMVIGW